MAAFVCLIVWLLPHLSSADDAAGTSVHLTLRYQGTVAFDDTVLLPDTITFPYTDETGAPAATTTAAQTALVALITADAASDQFSLTNLSYYPAFNDFLVNCISVLEPTGLTPACFNWKYVVNGSYPPIGMGQFTVHDGDAVYIYFGDRYGLSTDKTEYEPTEPVRATLTEYDYVSNLWAPSVDHTILATEPILPDFSNFPPTTVTSTSTDSQGQGALGPFDVGTYYITIPNEYWPGVTVTVTGTLSSTSSTPGSATGTVRLIVRHEDEFIFDGNIALPTSTVITYHEGDPTMTFTTTSERSTVLSTLVSADNASDAFLITDLQYYPSFSSFLLNCVTTPSSTPACSNWNFVVEGVYQMIGMDQYLLAGGETVYVYFGSPWSVDTDISTVSVGTPVTFTTRRYRYDALAEPWTPDPFTNLLISSPNPSSTDPWDAWLPIATTTSDAAGLASYTFSTTGTYAIEITSDDYSKTSQKITITVTEAPSPNDDEADDAPPPPPPSGGCTACGGPPAAAHPTLDVEAAIRFLSSVQQADGSFGNVLYSDWAAIAFGAYPETVTATDALADYLIANPDALVTGNPATDYTRRAMALMALGISPYSGTPTNYIDLIIREFDGTQFGTSTLVNDDIFVLFPLLNAGYSAGDEMIAKTVQFILSNQESDGSWVGTDVTAAGIQALSLLPPTPEITSAVSRAKSYLHIRQGANASFDDNVFSTSWAMQAIAALGDAEIDWIKNNQTPGEYLRSKQAADGGVNAATADSRIWATSYAIPAAFNKAWDDILVSFSRPEDTEAPANANPQPTGGQQPRNEAEVLTPTSTEREAQAATSTPPTETDGLEEFDGTGGGIGATEDEGDARETLTTENAPAARPTARNTRGESPDSELAFDAVLDLSGEQAISATSTTTLYDTQPESEANEQTLSSAADAVPINKTAKGVFAGAAAISGTLGAYLVWRFLQTLV